MSYKVVWKYEGQLYTEHKDIEGVTYILDSLDRWDGYELISITPCKE